MTPKEKAASIVKSYQNIPMLKDFGGMDLEIAKECAKIHVNGIINALLFSFVPKDKEALDYYNEVFSELFKP